MSFKHCSDARKSGHFLTVLHKFSFAVSIKVTKLIDQITDYTQPPEDSENKLSDSRTLPLRCNFPYRYLGCQLKPQTY